MAKDYRLNTECGCELGQPHKPGCRYSIQACKECGTPQAGGHSIHLASCSVGIADKERLLASLPPEAIQASPRATAERVTAGPLTVHKKSTLSGLERSQDWAIVDSDNQIIAECFGISGHKPGTSPKEYLHQPAEANARLFAAAPELRDALFEVHELLFLICHVFCKNNPPPQGFARLERAAAVLAKVLP